MQDDLTGSTHSRRGWLPRFAKTVGKGFIYAVMSWTVYAGAIRPSPANSDTKAEDAAQDANQARVEANFAQFDRQMAESKQQVDRGNAIHADQEVLIKRWAAVMTAWEKQAGVAH